MTLPPWNRTWTRRKRRPMDPRVAEELAHLFGAGAGGDVEVLGAVIEEQVADAAADQVGLVPVPDEAAQDLLDVGIDPRLVEHDVVTAGSGVGGGRPPGLGAARGPLVTDAGRGRLGDEWIWDRSPSCGPGAWRPVVDGGLGPGDRFCRPRVSAMIYVGRGSFGPMVNRKCRGRRRPRREDCGPGGDWAQGGGGGPGRRNPWERKDSGMPGFSRQGLRAGGRRGARRPGLTGRLAGDGPESKGDERPGARSLAPAGASRGRAEAVSGATGGGRRDIGQGRGVDDDLILRPARRDDLAAMGHLGRQAGSGSTTPSTSAASSSPTGSRRGTRGGSGARSSGTTWSSWSRPAGRASSATPTVAWSERDWNQLLDACGALHDIWVEEGERRGGCRAPARGGGARRPDGQGRPAGRPPHGGREHRRPGALREPGVPPDEMIEMTREADV